jgi:ATP-dependent helicase HepA
LTAGRAGTATEDDLAGLFAALCQCAATDWDAVDQFVAIRRGAPVSGALRALLGEAVRGVSIVPRFDGEGDALEDLLDVVNTPAEALDHVHLAARSVARILLHARTSRVPARVVAFTAYSPAARRLASILAHEQEGRVVECLGAWMSQEERQAALDRFHDTSNSAVLVTLRRRRVQPQTANWLVHVDLPWNPSRMEQRAGRLDRIGQIHPIHTRLILNDVEENGILAAWARFLGLGLGVFANSIANLQYFTAALLPTVLRAALRGSARPRRARAVRSHKQGG